MPSENKEYTNGEITISWKPDVCIHSAKCIRALPGVFNPNERPWIKIKNADTPHLIEAVDGCPSGAISYTRIEPEALEDQVQTAVADNTRINIFKDGPIEIKGDFEMTDMAGNKVDDMKKVYLCRCGASGNKPFCDGSHKKAGFEG